ncbi:MAG: outer membrane lipoprotein carrier protein LolA [Candidatus Aminicenantes bacterium]|nr:outer membrane lipoprotein carrier protein LolA [Candidatus Aminicenantes bacterium]MDH5466570.1 outer membrane lipoprotein carrier protein LolA [Candidatus Aminicenantes bacterium]MDH5705174.1 outer membrane lipoprotein carrier protein LolA [Candidatus Aminicenantes bacterium]
MRYVFCVFFLSLFSLATTVEDVVGNVEMKLRSIRSLQANFIQSYYSSNVSTPLEEKGDFYFQKPDWMRWEYKDPEEKIFLYKEDVFWFYFPEDKEVIQSNLSKEKYESEILSLLSGKKNLKDDYTIEFSAFPSESPKTWKLKLTPREESDYTHILLEIDERTWLIRKAIFFDWAGNKQEFHFTQIKTNIRFPQSVFELRLPPDVEIIKDEPIKKK